MFHTRVDSFRSILLCCVSPARECCHVTFGVDVDVDVDVGVGVGVNVEYRQQRS